MSETPTPNNAEYLEHHPDAIQDVGRAHVMARASDKHESAAAALRHVADIANMQTSNSPAFERQARSLVLANETPEHLKGVDLRIDIEARSADLSVDGLTKEISYRQDLADKAAKFAGDAYDKIQSTKR